MSVVGGGDLSRRCPISYAPVLPDIPDSLGWSHPATSFVGTMNAAEYLIVALIVRLCCGASAGPLRDLVKADLQCVTGVCALSGSLIPLPSIAWPAWFARAQSRPTTMVAVSAIGAMLPMFSHSAPLLAISAVLFGVAFFAVVGSSNAFLPLDYPPAAWPTAIPATTCCYAANRH